MTFRSRTSAAARCFLALLVSGCGGDPRTQGPSQPADGESATAGGQTSGSSRARDRTAGEAPRANEGEAAPQGEQAPEQPPRGTSEFPGLPADITFAGMPAACSATTAGATLELQLSAGVPAIKLQVAAGHILVNSQACDGGGVPLLAADVRELRVSGGAEDNAVVLDLGGDWSALLDAAESIELDLGAGDNVLVVVGTEGADQIHHAARQSRVLLAFSGDGHANMVAAGLSALGLRLDAGDDRVGDLGALLKRSGASTPAGLAPIDVPLFVRGGDGDDAIAGGERDDELDGGLGDDTLSGLAGNDTFFAAATWDGDDVLNGGDGFDQLSYALRAQSLVLSGCVSPAFEGCEPPACDCTSSSGEADEDDRVVNFESLSGGSGDDYLLGGPGDDTFFGGNGNDSLIGSDGSDLLLGQFGLDLLEGGSDEDICDTQPDEQANGCEI